MESTAAPSSRCLFLEASHPDLDFIQELRFRYDPLADKISPHVTVLFPFAAAEVSSADIISLMGSLGPSKPIPFSLGKPTASGMNLYFPLEKGAKEVLALRASLHEMLADLNLPGLDYRPHLIFGLLPAGQSVDAILAEAAAGVTGAVGTLDALVLERIGATSESIVECRTKLGG